MLNPTYLSDLWNEKWFRACILALISVNMYFYVEFFTCLGCSLLRLLIEGDTMESPGWLVVGFFYVKYYSFDFVWFMFWFLCFLKS